MDGSWLLENIERIGVVVLLVFFVYLVLAEHVVLGPFHRREVEAGKQAIATLEKVNPVLKELEITAAVQKVRDEYGKTDQDRAAAQLRDCLANLDQCRNIAPPSRNREPA